MKKTIAIGMALALGCMACAGPKVTELDAQIAMMQTETARACYAAEAAKALAVFDFSQALAILAPMEKNLAEGHPAPDAGAKPPA